jgi:acyl-CoA thioesterase
MVADPTGEEGRAVDLARRCAEAMWSEDAASVGLGMRLVAVAPGYAQVTMPATERMVNGHGIVHGGFLAALADSAFAVACNTYGDVTVAAGFDIVFVASGRRGDQLTADAVERARYGRSGLYDVTVRATDPAGEVRLLAEFRGRSRSLGRPFPPVQESIGERLAPTAGAPEETT